MRFATATCGFGPTNGYADVLGLVPPMAGCEWQEPQEFELKVGPSPPFPGLGSCTPCTSVNCDKAVAKNRCWSALSPATGSPAPMDPPRGPGSTACPYTVPMANRGNNDSKHTRRSANFRCAPVFPIGLSCV